MADDNTTGLNIPIGADPSGLRQGFREAENIVSQGADRIQRSLQGITNIGQQLAGLGAALSASITLPLAALATKSVQAYGEIQSLKLGLEAVGGSASYAAKQFKELQQVAKLPGLGLKEAVKGSINLQAIGFSAGNAKNILLQFGNAVATVGKGRVEFDRAIYGVTQLANTEFPLGEDLNIIKDALPQVSTLLKAAFGTSRTEDLQRLKVSSKEVMDVILTGLEKLPRVNGGIKNAFENLGDSIQQNLGRIGKVIDDRLNISALIDKLTGVLDKLISKFEDLSPVAQTTVLVIAGLAAAIGPLLLGLGGILLAVPLVVNGFNAARTAVIAFNQALLANPYTAIAVGLAAIGAALYVYYSNLETARDRQERFNNALGKATIEARNETNELKKLYEVSQDQNKSLEERNKAVDQLQKQYPFYFANLSNEAILTGKAGLAYKNLTVDIYNASRARAAQSELDKRNTDRLERELELREKLRGAYEALSKNTPEAVIKFNQENPFDGIDIRQGIQTGVKKYIKTVLDELGSGFKQANKEDFSLSKIIGLGQDAITKLDTPGLDSFLPGLEKIKKETEKQLAEIYPIGSIAELRQRADLLVKAIETSNNDIIKVRGLDAFGKDKNKAGTPIYTGEILSREKAVERLADLNMLIGEELKPVEFKSRGLLDQFGNEFESLNELIFNQTTKFAEVFNRLPTAIRLGIDAAILEAARITELTEKLNEGLNNVISSGVTEGITDAFSSIGKSLAEGGNIFESLGKSLLGSFGKILGELGKQMIQYGVGLLAIKIAMKSMNPYVAIAAGAALVALGAGISASVAKQSDSIGGGGNISSASGVNQQSFSASNTTSQGFSGGEYVFRLSGTDLIAAFNRNVSAQDRVTA